MNKFLNVIGLIVGLIMLLTYSIIGETFVVNTAFDSHDLSPGDGIAADHADPALAKISLRAALEEANALPGPDTVLLADDTLIILITIGPLVIVDDSTLLLGSGNFPIIDGSQAPLGSSLLEIRSTSNKVMGVTFRRSRHHGLAIYGSDNSIGDSSSTGKNIFIGCGLDYSDSHALVMSGSGATNNRVLGNWIGLHGNGIEVYGNRNGILLEQGASQNSIGYQKGANACFISGNAGYGLCLTSGATNNKIFGCTIGLDLTYLRKAGNLSGGIIINQADSNRIGGDSASSLNIICGNGADGIIMTGSNSHHNQIAGNYVGLDTTGLISIANEGSALVLKDGAHDNLIGAEELFPANVFSGNFGDGILLTDPGTINNRIIGNHIGVSSRGGGLYAGDTYNYNGLTIQNGASYNTIGGISESTRNVISLNEKSGIIITGLGTTENIIIGNFIGITGWGISSAPNGTGVVIRGGAKSNRIGGADQGERNIISGNRADIFPWGAGVVIYDPGTSDNLIYGNYIGTDQNGSRALRNGSSGVIIGNGATNNAIGGLLTGQGNIISGNGAGPDVFTIARGVTIIDFGTNYNLVAGNAIGIKADSSGYLANWGHGVGIFSGAQYNLVGGETTLAGNLIVGNDAHGILIDGSSTKFNSLRSNSIFGNDSLPVALRNSAQEELTPPVLIDASTGHVIGNNAPPNGMVDIFWLNNDLANVALPSLVGSGQAEADGSFNITLTSVSPGDSLVAIATDQSGNSSEQSQTIIAHILSDTPTDNLELPLQFSLAQNYPNPFNPSTNISFTLAEPDQVELKLFNLLGQQVVTLASGYYSKDSHTVTWDGHLSNGRSAPSGIYFYRLTTDNRTASRRLLLLR